MDAQPLWWRTAKPFVNGGLAGCIGLSIMHPADLVKVRIQLGQGSASDILRNVIQKEGLRSFYNGWSAQMVRQLTYGTVRLGSFGLLRDAYSKRDCKGEVIPLPFSQKVFLGLVAGTGGAIAGNPAEVSLVRMQADKMLPDAERRFYRNVFQAMYRIICDEGVLTLWRGCGSTVMRAAAINASSLACYDQTKEVVDTHMGTRSGWLAITSAATSSGVVAAASSMPFDYVKTQLQQMRQLPDGTMPFTGMQDCAIKTLRQRGPWSFYAGFPVYCVRICPAVAIIFLSLECIVNVQKKHGF